MPNWCDNNLVVTGKKHDIEDFLKKVTVNGGYDILQSLYPCPQELKETVSGWSGDEEEQKKREEKYAENLAKYGEKDWYYWCVNNWGTKWGDCDTELMVHQLDKEDAFIEFSFTSAWSPPVDGITYISTLYPDCEFSLSYIEEGFDFCGATYMVNGRRFLKDVSLSESEIDALVSPYPADGTDDQQMDWYSERSDAIAELRSKVLEEVLATPVDELEIPEPSIPLQDYLKQTGVLNA